MIYAFLWIFMWVILWLISNFSIPIEYSHYSAVVILWLLDAIIWAIRADIVDKTFNNIVFLSWLLFNAIFALFITYLWESLGLNLYLAATVVFTFRIFQNVWITRRVLLDKWIYKQSKKNTKSKK